MNLTQFLKKADTMATALSREELLSFIHLQARILPDGLRDDFLEQLSECGIHTVKSIDVKMAADLDRKLAEIDGKLSEIEEGELHLVADLEEYGSYGYSGYWEDDEDEFSYSDPDGITDIISYACTLVDQCMDCERYQDAMNLAERLTTISITAVGEYYDDVDMSLQDLEREGLLDISLREFTVNHLIAAYFGSSGSERCSQLFRIFQNVPYDDLSLEELMQEGLNESIRKEEFLADWIDFLGTQGGQTAERLIKEAVLLTDDRDVITCTAKRFADIHPGLYEQIFTECKEWFSSEQIDKLFSDALEQIPTKYVLRSQIALMAAENAASDQISANLTSYWVEAFRSDTNSNSCLRLLLNAPEVPTSEIEQIVRSTSIGKQDIFFGYSVRGESELNEMTKTDYYAIQFFRGLFNEVLEKGMGYAKALGWGQTFMKCGMALFLLFLYKGEKLLSGGRSMCSRIVHDIDFSSEEYRRGLPGNEEIPSDDVELFWALFQKWRDGVSMSEDKTDRLIKRLDHLIEKRTKGIIEAKHRNYYGECASYIAAFGEALESRGKAGATQHEFMRYRKMYSRYSAFQRELRAYGMEK